MKRLSFFALRLIVGLVALALSFVSLSLLLSPILPSFEEANIASSRHVFFVSLGAVSLIVAVKIWVWVTIPRGSQNSEA